MINYMTDKIRIPDMVDEKTKIPIRDYIRKYRGFKVRDINDKPFDDCGVLRCELMMVVTRIVRNWGKSSIKVHEWERRIASVMGYLTYRDDEWGDHEIEMILDEDSPNYGSTETERITAYKVWDLRWLNNRDKLTGSTRTKWQCDWVALWRSMEWDAIRSVLHADSRIDEKDLFGACRSEGGLNPQSNPLAFLNTIRLYGYIPPDTNGKIVHRDEPITLQDAIEGALLRTQRNVSAYRKVKCNEVQPKIFQRYPTVNEFDSWIDLIKQKEAKVVGGRDYDLKITTRKFNDQCGAEITRLFLKHGVSPRQRLKFVTEFDQPSIALKHVSQVKLASDPTKATAAKSTNEAIEDYQEFLDWIEACYDASCTYEEKHESPILEWKEKFKERKKHENIITGEVSYTMPSTPTIYDMEAFKEVLMLLYIACFTNLSDVGHLHEFKENEKWMPRTIDEPDLPNMAAYLICSHRGQHAHGGHKMRLSMEWHEPNGWSHHLGPMSILYIQAKFYAEDVVDDLKHLNLLEEYEITFDNV